MSFNPTCFSQLIGNEQIKNQLNQMIDKRAVGHALLFAGPEGVGKSLFAQALAARLMNAYDPGRDHSRKISAGQHPDIHVYRPEGKLGLHSIQSLRQLSEEVHLPPYEASWKVFIVHDADRMLSYSANALLKTFEEPPPRTLIILLSRSQASLLPTILSRCSTLHFRCLPDGLIQDFLKRRYAFEEAKAEKIVRLAQGSLGRAASLAKQGDTVYQLCMAFLAKDVRSDYRSFQKDIEAICEQIEAAKKQSEDQAKEEMKAVYQEKMSAQQQQALEKELEGLVAMTYSQEARSLFEYILSWYRDCQFLSVGGNGFEVGRTDVQSALSNPEYYQELEQAVQRGGEKPLDKVYKAVEEAYLALQRSTSLALCLENLFLKLDYL